MELTYSAPSCSPQQIMVKARAMPPPVYIDTVCDPHPHTHFLLQHGLPLPRMHGLSSGSRECGLRFYIVTRCVATPPLAFLQSVVDLKACVYDKLYRATIVVKNRGNNALKCLTTVPPCLRGVVEFIPDMFYLQVCDVCSWRCVDAVWALCRGAVSERRGALWPSALANRSLCLT